MESGEWRIAAAAVILVLGCTLFLFDTPSYIAHVLLSGGSVNSINITTSGSPGLWEGLFGNLSSSAGMQTVAVTGSSVQGLNVYSACPSAQTGEIYFAKSSAISYSSLVAGDVAALDTLLGVSAASALSATTIFNDTTAFIVDGAAVNAPSALLVSSVGQRVGLLRETTLNIPVLVTNITLDSPLYNGQVGDYQIMLPVYGGQPFNVSLDPSDECPDICGNSVCDANETTVNCPVDCPASNCGNGDCDVSELCSTCAVDCGFCFPDDFGHIVPFESEGPSPQQPPIKPATVTPGTTAQPEPKPQRYSSGFSAETLYVDPPEISMKVQQGDHKYTQVRVLSTYSRSLVLTVEFVGDISPFITTDRSTLLLSPRSDQVLPLTFSASIENPPGTYTGAVRLLNQNNAALASIPITLQVLQGNAAFTFNLETVQQRVQGGQQVDVAYEFKGVPDREITFLVELFDVKSQKAVVSQKSTMHVVSDEQGTVSLQVPADVRLGRYLVTGTASYVDLEGNTITASDVTYVRIISFAYIYFLGIPLLGLILLAIGMAAGSTIKKSISHKQDQTAVLMLEEHFQEDHPLLMRLDVNDSKKNKVLIIEARKRLLRKLEAQARLKEDERESARKYLTSMVISMREFAKRLNTRRYDVHYYKSHTINEAVSTFLTKYDVEKLYVQRPRDSELLDILHEIAASHPQVEIE